MQKEKGEKIWIESDFFQQSLTFLIFREPGDKGNGPLSLAGADLERLKGGREVNRDPLFPKGHQSHTVFDKPTTARVTLFKRNAIDE